MYSKGSFCWDKPEVFNFSCIRLGITAYIVTKVKGGKSPQLKHHIFRCAHTSLEEAVSVDRSVRRSVMLSLNLRKMAK